MKGVDEDESEHTRLMKEQEEYEKQSMYEMPNIDDNEYTRLIEISESQRKRDVNMEDHRVKWRRRGKASIRLVG